MSRDKKIGIIKHLIIWLAIAFAMFPVAWTFSASINPANTLVGQTIVPPDVTFEHYRTLATSTQHPFFTLVME